MTKLLVQFSSEGAHIPAKLLEEAGMEPGAILELDVAQLLAPAEIQRRASHHTVWKLGDAIRVAWPVWEAGEWAVDLLSYDGSQQIGRLYYDPRGTLIEGKSTTRETLG